MPTTWLLISLSFFGMQGPSPTNMAGGFAITEYNDLAACQTALAERQRAGAVFLACVRKGMDE